LALITLLALPLVWWYNPRDCAVCDRGATLELIRRGFDEWPHDSILRPHHPERQRPMKVDLTNLFSVSRDGSSVNVLWNRVSTSLTRDEALNLAV
jgi:hypothetical protein